MIREWKSQCQFCVNEIISYDVYSLQQIMFSFRSLSLNIEPILSPSNIYLLFFSMEWLCFFLPVDELPKQNKTSGGTYNMKTAKTNTPSNKIRINTEREIKRLKERGLVS